MKITNAYEQDLIFGSLMENVKDIIALGEERDPLSGEGVGDRGELEKAQEVARRTRNARIDSEKMIAHKSGPEKETAIRAFNSAAKRDIAAQNTAAAVANRAIMEDGENTAIDTINRNIENKQKQKRDIDARAERNKENIDKQIDTLENQKSRISSAAKASENKQTMTESENESEKKARLAGVEQADDKHEGDNGIASAYKEDDDDNDDGILSEAAQVAQKRFAQMLFNGTSGSALKYFLYGEINNENRNEIAVAKYMDGDREVMKTIERIKKYLSKASRNRFSDKDYMDLKAEKLHFRLLFHKFKKERGL